MLPIINILLIVGILLFILYNLYVDTRNWSNTGSFLEGMENAGPTGGTYYYASEEKTFMEHYAAALQMNGNLASIHSIEDNQKVLDVIEGNPTRVFIGAIRKRPGSGDSADKWAWTDGSKWNYANWRAGEPNDCCKAQTGNIGEIYGEIQKSDGKWNDIFHQHNGNIQKFPAVYKLNVVYPNIILNEKQSDGTKSWQQAKELCEADGGKLASRRQILDFIKGKPAAFDKWVPTSDSNNSWLEVGNRKSRSGLSPDYGLLHQDIPDVAYNPNYGSGDGKPTWGTTNTAANYRKSIYCEPPTASGVAATCQDKIQGCDVHKANGGCLDANPNHDSWRKSCVKTCGYCDDPKYNPVPNALAASGAGSAETEAAGAGSAETAMDNEIKKRAGNVAPMGSNVPQNCKKGCVAPTGPNGNCKVVQKDGVEKRECYYGCPNPTLERGDTENCAYDRDCNSCGTIMFNPDDPPQIGQMGQMGQMGQGQMDQGQMAQGQMGMGQMPQGQMGSMEMSTMTHQSGSAATTAANVGASTYSLFNENIMKQVLANRDLIPSDINSNNEETSYNSRIGKKFMIDTATIRNFALPNIDEEDYIELGRIVKKIKMTEKDPQSIDQVKTLYSKLNQYVLELLTDSSLDMSGYDNRGTPSQINNKTRTTGMFGENSNSLIKEKVGKQRIKPYNSIWSLYH